MPTGETYTHSLTPGRLTKLQGKGASTHSRRAFPVYCESYHTTTTTNENLPTLSSTTDFVWSIHALGRLSASTNTPLDGDWLSLQRIH